MNSSALHFNISALMGNKSFNHEDCAATLTSGLQNGTIPWNSSIFISSDFPNFANPSLSIDWCQAICGSKTGWYSDSVPRLFGWFLPVFLLVSNMQFAPIGWSRFLVIFHLFGDPIDSTWSLLDKVDSWRFHATAARKRVPQPSNSVRESIAVISSVRKSIAVINCAMEELPHRAVTDEETQETNPTRHPTNLYEGVDDGLLLQTASALMRNRRNDILRTVLAIVIYIFQTLTFFVKSLGSPSSGSAGKIGPAMLLSWLVSVSLLSNAVGDLGPPRSNQIIIADFKTQIGPPPGQSSSGESRTSHEEPAAWSGVVFCYNPNKCLASRGWVLASISALPVAIAFGTSLAVLETGPTYFSCRNLFVICSFGLWIFSAASTYGLSRVRCVSEKWRWSLILIKDVLVGGLILSLIIATTCGYWNTCSCWAGELLYGAGAPVYLNATQAFNLNDDVKYPAMVATGLSLQGCVFGAMVWVGLPGYTALWWSEREKSEPAESNRSRTAPSTDVQEDHSQEQRGEGPARMGEMGPEAPESIAEAFELKERNVDGKDQGPSMTIQELRACEVTESDKRPHI
jgi:hypothetical protein